jgi:hypothetical protein
MAPFELTLYSFLDAEGVEQPFTTTDAQVARDYAARNNLVMLANAYEFVSSQPVADFTADPAVIAGN